MAFITLLFSVISIFILIIGIILCITGLILLLIYFIKRKTGKKKGLLIASIILLIIGILVSLSFTIASSFSNNISVNLYISPDKYPVINAIAKHDNNRLIELLTKGANPDEIFNDMPALFWTCEFDYGANSEAARLLLLYNANMYAKMNPDYENRSSSLMKFILTNTYQAGDEQEIYKIVTLLINNGYDINETDNNGISSLMYANVHSVFDAEYPLSLNTIKLLIKSGADMKQRDIKGRTVLMWSCGSSGSATSNGSDISDAPEIEEKHGFAPFNHDIIKYLIINGADIHAKDNKGYTAFDYFRQTEENSGHWGQYKTKGKSKAYTDQCNAIEELLKIK